MEPLEPLHPLLVEYRAEVQAILDQPARAARLAELEALSRATRSVEEYRAVGALIVAFLDEVHEEVDAARRAAGKPVPWRSGQPRPSSFGQSSTPASPGQISGSLGGAREADGHRSGSSDALTSE